MLKNLDLQQLEEWCQSQGGPRPKIVDTALVPRHWTYGLERQTAEKLYISRRYLVFACSGACQLQLHMLSSFPVATVPLQKV
jgi:hypothetical protein